MNLPGLAVKRPVTVVMLIVMAILLGGVSLSRLGVDLFPRIKFPIAVVATTYQGAGPREVEKLVTKPIEEAVSTVSGVKSITSTSSEDASAVIVEFEWGTDMDFATLKLRERVERIQGFLPADVDSPSIFNFDLNEQAVLEVALGGARDLGQLKDLAEDTIKPRLERLEGVASVAVIGGLEREIQVLVDPRRLEAYGLTLDRLAGILGSENLNLPGGRVEQAEKKVLIRTTGEFRDLAEIQAIPVATPTGAIRLDQVAEVRDTFREQKRIARLGGRQAIGLSIQKETDANTVKVATAALLELEKIKAELPQEITVFPVADQSEYIKSSISSVVNNAVAGGILAVLILFVFLRNWRTTLVVGASIPVSIIATFSLVYFYGITLNMISLGGLALGIGMLVDNAIVVLESIYRHRQGGADGEAAAVAGTNEVGTAISASTFTTVAVFIPVVFIAGIAAEIFTQLALTVSFSLLVSLAVSLTLVPMLMAQLFRSEDRPTPGRVRAGRVGQVLARGRLGQAFDRVYGAMENQYVRALAWALGRRGWVVAIAVLALVASLAAVPLVGTEFFPGGDAAELRVEIELPEGSQVQQTETVVGQVAKIVDATPEVTSVFSQSGAGTGQGETRSEFGYVTARLLDQAERQRTTADVVEDIRRRVTTVPGAEIRVSESGGMHGYFGSPIQVKVKGNDMDVLAELAKKVAARVSKIPGTREVKSGVEGGQPEIQVVLDRDQAARMGLTAGQVAAAVRAAFEGQVATRYRVGGDEVDIRVMAEEGSRTSVADLERLLIAAPGGVTVSLGDIAELVPALGPTAINREKQVRAVMVTGQLAGRPLGDVMADITAAVGTMPVPPGYEVEVGGEMQDMMESFKDLSMALVIAILLVYMILASQFESLVYPLSIMLAVPFALVGAILALLISGRNLSIPAFIGIIMLTGIVVNNAIVLVDYVNTLRRRGMARNEAILTAGPVRLRPILMTTLTTILGMLPLALGIGTGSEMETPLSTVVVGGLTLSTVLTLVVVPVFYSLFDDLGVRVRAKVARFQGAVQPEPQPGDD